MYTFVGEAPSPLQVVIGKVTVIVTWSVTLKVAGEIVTCEKRAVENSPRIKVNKAFFFIA